MVSLGSLALVCNVPQEVNRIVIEVVGYRERMQCMCFGKKKGNVWCKRTMTVGPEVADCYKKVVLKCSVEWDYEKVLRLKSLTKIVVKIRCWVLDLVKRCCVWKWVSCCVGG